MIQFTNEFLLIFVFGLLKEILFYLVEVTKTPRTQNLIESFKLSRYLIFSYMEFFYMNILPVIAFFFQNLFSHSMPLNRSTYSRTQTKSPKRAFIQIEMQSPRKVCHITSEYPISHIRLFLLYRQPFLFPHGI